MTSNDCDTCRGFRDELEEIDVGFLRALRLRDNLAAARLLRQRKAKATERHWHEMAGHGTPQDYRTLHHLIVEQTPPWWQQSIVWAPQGKEAEYRKTIRALVFVALVLLISFVCVLAAALFAA